MNRRVKQIVYLCAALLFLLTSVEMPAKAYADPGSGALLWQGLLAALVGATYYSRRLIQWLRRWLQRDPGK